MSTDVISATHEVSSRAGQTGRVEHFSLRERAARGKAARAEVPRSAHADWAPAPLRRSPVELLEAQAGMGG